MITIVGSGLVGSLLAILLKQRGFAVQVFEKRSDPRKSNISAGRSINLVITSRGLYGLELAGLTKEIRSLAVPVFGRMMHSVAGETTFQPYGQEHEFNLSISRDSLNRFLISKAEESGVKFYFDYELTSVDFRSRKAQFSIEFDASNSAKKSYVTSFDVLFGADGAGSKVRKTLAENFPSEIAESTEWLEADYKELTLPLDSKGQPQLKTDALHIWPRGDHMMMALANKDGSFTTTIYLPKKSFDNLKTRESVEELFWREFKDAIPLIPNYVDEFLNHPQGTLGTVRCNHWIKENVVLIGDAAHAIVPFFGQGMNCGFEDCTELVKLLDEYTTSEKKTYVNNYPENVWAEILKTYETNRKPNADAIAAMALENWVEMRDKVADQNFLLRKKVESLLEKRHPSTYKSRYGLITYTLVPYELAQQAGRLQDEMFMELLANAEKPEDVDWKQADRLMESCWVPFLKRHNLQIKKYPQ